MPSDKTLPTIPEMLDAAAAGLWGRRQTADSHRGSLYDVQAGVGAILWVREATRDRDSFRACYDDFAQGDVLEWRITSKGGPARIQATRGQGTALLTYAPGAPAAPGAFLAGSRIGIGAVGQLPRFYRIASDTPFAAGETGKTVPIEAQEIGPGVAIDTGKLNDPRLWWEDLMPDAGWRATSLVCADGTKRETDQEYRARWRQSKIDRRVGYRKAISDACVAAGAVFVVLLESDFASSSPDRGINRVWVANAAYQSPPELLRACRLAVDQVRVLGCDLTVWGIARTPASFALTAHLWDHPGNVDQAAVRTSAQYGVQHYFSSRDNGFAFKRDGLTADVLQACPEVQSLDFGAGDPTDVAIASLMESTALPLLYTDRSLIDVTLAAPV